MKISVQGGGTEEQVPIDHRIKDDRMEKYSCFIVFVSKKHCPTAKQNVLADERGGCVADGRLCRSRVAAKCSFS